MAPWIAALATGIFAVVVSVLCDAIAKRQAREKSLAERHHAARHTSLTLAIALEGHCQLAGSRTSR